MTIYGKNTPANCGETCFRHRFPHLEICFLLRLSMSCRRCAAGAALVVKVKTCKSTDHECVMCILKGSIVIGAERRSLPGNAALEQHHSLFHNPPTVQAHRHNSPWNQSIHKHVAQRKASSTHLMGCVKARSIMHR